MQRGQEMTENDEQWAIEHIRAINKCENRGGGKTNPKNNADGKRSKQKENVKTKLH